MELSSIRRCFVAHRESNANTNSPTLYSNLHFNQRTRMGCDIDESKTLVYVRCFNPRTRMGCDRILSNELNIIVQIYRICE